MYRTLTVLTDMFSAFGDDMSVSAPRPPPVFARTARSGVGRPDVLGEAEPVAGVVAEGRLDPVGTLGRLLQELDAPPAELLVGATAVGGREDAHAQGTLGEDRLELLG